MKYDAIVVGAGISGLLTSLVLSRNGKNVLILEKDGFVGGNLRSYAVDGYRVDTGPHAITHINDGPLKVFMDDYFSKKPAFLPYGGYYVRVGKKLTPFPWTIQSWVNFDVLPKGDRFKLMHIMASALVKSSFGRADLEKSLYDYLKKYSFSERTWKFVDALSYFMSGKSMREVPAWRMLKGARYIEEDEGRYAMKRTIGRVSKLRKLVSYDGAYHQAYPKNGIGAITDSVLGSMPEKRVTIRTGEEVKSFIDKRGVIAGVSTDTGNYDSDFVVYSGFMKDLPELTGKLPKGYEDNLKKLEQTTSITVWLGLKRRMREFSYTGSEIWFDSGKPYWAMPTSNYNGKFAPKGGQLVGFTSFVEKDAKYEEKKLMETAYSAIPNLEKNVEMKHVQVTNPEKAAITTDAKFPGQKSPLDGLYLVGTDTDPRSMGVTRAAFSVLNLIEVLKADGLS